MSTEIKRYQFNDLLICVEGLGLDVSDDRLSAACDKLTVDQLKDANKEAWKQRKEATRLANSAFDIARTESGSYDLAVAHEIVCKAVCKETWKRILNMQMVMASSDLESMFGLTAEQTDAVLNNGNTKLFVKLA